MKRSSGAGVGLRTYTKYTHPLPLAPAPTTPLVSTGACGDASCCIPMPAGVRPLHLFSHHSCILFFNYLPT